MTRLRQIALAGLAAVAIGGAASSASAMEIGNFENRLGGATIGLPLGAAPPPGLYTGLETAYLGMLNSSGSGGHSAGSWCVPSAGGGCANLPALAQAVPLLWVPGWNFLGATYSFSVVQAFYEFHTCGGAADAGGNCRVRRRTGHRVLKRRLCVYQHLRRAAHSVVETGRRLVRVFRLRLHPAGRHADSRHAEPRFLDI